MNGIYKDKKQLIRDIYKIIIFKFVNFPKVISLLSYFTKYYISYAYIQFFSKFTFIKYQSLNIFFSAATSFVYSEEYNIHVFLILFSRRRSKFSNFENCER